jgi:two-component system, response regulator YesN
MEFSLRELFDIEEAKKRADLFRKTTDLDCTIINKYGTTIYSTGGDTHCCEFCSAVSAGISNFPGCKYVHLYGAYQSERFGGSYVFFCQTGLVHFASPIIINGFMEGALLGGPVLIVDHEEFLEYDLKQNLKKDIAKDKKIKDELMKIKYISTEKVNAYSETLKIFAASLSDSTISGHEKKWEKQHIQDEISSSLHYEKQQNSQKYPIEKEKQLIRSIKLGDKASAQKYLNEIFGYVYFSSGSNFEEIKARSLELIVLLSRASVEAGADEELIFGMNYEYISRILTFTSVEDLTQWFSNIMNRFTDQVFNLRDIKHADTIFKALAYIKENYMKKISLDDVAGSVYLIPSYFSKIFKQEMKCNFNTYINLFRIESSKELLRDPAVELVDIASIVGFEDQSYFSKVFKKIVGVSPGKYRESMPEKQFDS